MSGGSELRALAGAVEVGRVAGILAAAEVEVAPLKGIALQARLGLGRLRRPLGDVDLLVAAGRHEESVQRLRRAGYRVSARGRDGATVTLHSRTGIPVDLHGELFPPGLFALSSRGVFARAHRDQRSFGISVAFPDDLDLLAHGLGHFAKGRHGAADAARVEELLVLVEVARLEVGRCAAHLREHGLARAARYAFSCVAPTPWTHALLRSLVDGPGDARIADAVTFLARRLNGASGNRRTLTVAAPHLVNSSLPRGARSLALHLRDGLTQRTRRAVSG